MGFLARSIIDTYSALRHTHTLTHTSGLKCVLFTAWRRLPNGFDLLVNNLILFSHSFSGKTLPGRILHETSTCILHQPLFLCVCVCGRRFVAAFCHLASQVKRHIVEVQRGSCFCCRAMLCLPGRRRHVAALTLNY